MECCCATELHFRQYGEVAGGWQAGSRGRYLSSRLFGLAVASAGLGVFWGNDGL